MYSSHLIYGWTIHSISRVLPEVYAGVAHGNVIFPALEEDGSPASWAGRLGMVPPQFQVWCWAKNLSKIRLIHDQKCSDKTDGVMVWQCMNFESYEGKMQNCSVVGFRIRKGSFISGVPVWEGMNYSFRWICCIFNPFEFLKLIWPPTRWQQRRGHSLSFRPSWLSPG